MTRTATTAPLTFRRRPVYETGEVATLMGISDDSVCRALDTGAIPGGYRHPGSAHHRRITDAALAAYLRSDPSLADILARFLSATKVPVGDKGREPSMTTTNESQAPLDTLGRRLDRLCHERDISQIELASAVGLERSSLWKWRNNVQIPRSLASFIKLAEFFDVSLDWLACRSEERRTAGGDGRESRPEPAPSPVPSPASQDRQDLKMALAALHDLHGLAVEECVAGNAVDEAARLLDEFGLLANAPAGRGGGRAGE
jgi:transcriptional regulator with XRE-family HTH domain